MGNFIPDQMSVQTPQVPYFEDSKLHEVPGRGTEKSELQLQNEIRNLMVRLQAANVYFTVGKYYSGNGIPDRHGYLMTFTLNGIPGRMEIAALPLRKETDARKRDALKQSLYLVRQWLEAEIMSVMYRPGAVPLVPYLIGQGDKTVTELLAERGDLPLLVSGR